MIPQYLYRGYPVRVGVHVYAIKDSDKLNLALILIKKNCVNTCRHSNFETLHFKLRKKKKKTEMIVKKYSVHL